MSVDESLGDTVTVTVIATRFDDEAEIVRPPVQPRVEVETPKPSSQPQQQTSRGLGLPNFGNLGTQNNPSSAPKNNNNNSDGFGVIDIPPWMRQK